MVKPTSPPACWPKVIQRRCPTLCREAIDLASETGDQFFKALAYRTLAEAAHSLDAADRQRVEDDLREAIRLQLDIGAKPELAHSYVRYTQFLQAWGDMDQAKAYLTQAMGMFRHMGMTWALSQVEGK